MFTTTHWTMVLTAAQKESHQADAALEDLCRAYWRPIFAYLRRNGSTSHDAEDLTQAFFERVLNKDCLRAVDRTKGRFRSFLLAMLRHFLANHRRDSRTQKRGGRFQFISVDDDSFERPEMELMMADTTAEQMFDRQWAITLLDQVVSQLRAEYEASGKIELFDALRVFLTGERSDAGYSDLARTLNTTPSALKMAVSRMRRRYGELLRAEIGRTVSTPDEAKEELRSLFAALG